MKTAKTSENLLFACQDNLNNLWQLLHRFQKFAFSVKPICLHDNDTIKTNVFKSFHFGDRFQKLSVSVKTIIVFDRFRVNVRRKGYFYLAQWIGDISGNSDINFVTPFFI